MLIVRVELHSAVTGRVTEIARARIHNVGGTSPSIGDYLAETYHGRDGDTLDASQRTDRFTRTGSVDGHPRLAKHVWVLVFKALRAMGYDQ